MTADCPNRVDERAGVVAEGETGVITPSWVRGGRVISNHDVTRPGGRATPCFCWATAPHSEGEEQSTRPTPGAPA